MATLYWVGTGTWDLADTAPWSASSGGAGGAGVPAAGDVVIFDAASGAGVCTLGANVQCLTLTMTGYTGTLAFGTFKIGLTGNAATIFTGATTATITGTPVIECTYAGATGTRTIAAGAVSNANSISFHITAGTDTVTTSGTNATVRDFIFTGFSGTLTMPSARQVTRDLLLSSGMTVSASASTLGLRSTTTSVITSAGKTLDFPITVNGAGGLFTPADNFTMGSTRTLTLTNGTFDGNGKNISIGAFALGAGTKTLTMGGGTWSCAGGWDAATNVAGLTLNPTGTISMTSGSAKTFAGGGKSWPTLNQGGAGALTISGSNTFNDITATTLPSTISFTDGTTQTVAAFSARGTSGNLLTLGPTGVGAWSIGKAGGGPVNSDYLSISNSIALYRDWFAGRNSTDGGGNTGWRFTPYSSLIPLILPRRR